MTWSEIEVEQPRADGVVMRSKWFELVVTQHGQELFTTKLGASEEYARSLAERLLEKFPDGEGYLVSMTEFTLSARIVKRA